MFRRLFQLFFHTQLFLESNYYNKQKIKHPFFLMTNIFITCVTPQIFQAWQPKPAQFVNIETQKSACWTDSTKPGTGRTT